MSGASYKDLEEHLLSNQYSWLITGAAGFIGSHIAEKLIKLNQDVFGIDNFLTGNKRNIDLLSDLSLNNDKGFFSFDKIDISVNNEVSKLPKTDFVIHQAALGSVPRSIKNPQDTHKNNVNGFMNIIMHSVRARVRSFVYASSSSVYGDHLTLPKKEGHEGSVLSPYAATKLINEVYANVISSSYGLKTIGLRYFNVFGPRQDPKGEYAAVIPRWLEKITNNEPILVFGDGSTTRDFCYVDNAVMANLLSAFSDKNVINSTVLNIACGSKISLNHLAATIEKEIKIYKPDVKVKKNYKDFRKGDVKDSLANIDKAKKRIGYDPLIYFDEGLRKTIRLFFENH